MRELVQVELPTGQTMWASIESPDGPRDVGLADRFGRVTELPGLAEIMQWVGTGIADGLATGLRRVKPDRVSAEFGVELAVGEKGLVAALGGVSGKTVIKVTMSWGENGQASGAASAPVGPDE